jgi:hypothetical protein
LIITADFGWLFINGISVGGGQTISGFVETVGGNFDVTSDPSVQFPKSRRSSIEEFVVL